MNTISHKYGRVGNNIYQLLNILYESIKHNKKINIKTLYYLTPLFNIKQIEEYFNNNITINDNDNDNDTITDHFFPKNLHLSNERTVDLQQYFNIAQEFILPYISVDVSPLPEDVCVIHIRSGDQFSGSPHSGYVQPPTNYYIKIIEETKDKYNTFIIVTEPDKKNPCIKQLQEYSNKIKVISTSVKDDYTLLLRTQSIILSRSSFSDTSIFLNPNLKYLYFWNYSHCLCDTSIIPQHIHTRKVDLHAPYIKCGEWNPNKKEQLQLMIEYDIKDITMTIVEN